MLLSFLLNAPKSAPPMHGTRLVLKRARKLVFGRKQTRGNSFFAGAQYLKRRCRHRAVDVQLLTFVPDAPLGRGCEYANVDVKRRGVAAPHKSALGRFAVSRTSFTLHHVLASQRSMPPPIQSPVRGDLGLSIRRELHSRFIHHVKRQAAAARDAGKRIFCDDYGQPRFLGQ